ncbi:MAG: acyltransferase family protein [Chitinophagaceae bacterium]|nr:acyltransferase family protein [Chitinophagaceae bacterium]
MQTLPFRTAITTTTQSTTPAAVTDIPEKGASRLLYIDNLRWVMIMLVLSMHAAVTYSHLGSWYFMEDTPVRQSETFTFATYQVFLQSFFMGFLFFIAGYFVPKAYDTKGAARFLRDRAYRLGLPLLFFVFLLQPLSVYCIFLFDKQAPWNSFGDLYGRYIHKGWWLSGTGPLWFCEALLIFCTVYALFRVITRKMNMARLSGSKLPAKKTIWGFIALITGCSFLVRISWPNGTNFYNLQFCYFSQYVFFFSAGILAYRGNWLNGISTEMGRYWGRIAVIGGIAIWIAGIIFGGALKGHLDPYHGGWHWQSLLECFRDQLAGVGISIFLLAWFRSRFNSQGKPARFFSANAFAVYVFHTPVLITLSKMLIGLHWPLLLKFVLLTILSILVTYVLSAVILRRIPLLKNIL